MKKLRQFLLLFFFLCIVVLLVVLIYHIRIERLPFHLAFYSACKDLLYVIPVNGAISVLWSLVFKSPIDIQFPVRDSTLNFKIVMFVFIMLFSTFMFQEWFIPKLYDFVKLTEVLKEKNLKGVRIRDDSGADFKMSEFNRLVYMPVRRNIAFSTGNSYVYFEKMYDGNGAYYVEGFRFIAYTKGEEIDYIISSSYAKIVGYLLYAVNPIYYQYSNGQFSTAKKISGIKKIVLMYNPSGIYSLADEATGSIVSLIDVALNSDYVLNSRVSFYRVGNVVFNRIAYYLIIIFMMILSSAFGMAFRNRRLLQGDYIQTAAFYLLSLFMVVLYYDTLIAFLNFLYGFFI